MQTGHGYAPYPRRYEPQARDSVYVDDAGDRASYRMRDPAPRTYGGPRSFMNQGNDSDPQNGSRRHLRSRRLRRSDQRASKSGGVISLLKDSM